MEKNLLAKLTETSVKSADIEKIDFNRVSAEMSREGEQTFITLTYGDLKDGAYSLTEAPADNSLTVRRAVLDILGQINLQQLCMNLEASAALIDVAYNACNGIYGAHKSLYKLRTDVYDTVCDSVAVSMDFKNASALIIKALIQVYENLSSTDECDIDLVRLYLSKIPKAAKGMSEQANELSNRFSVLKTRALDEGENIVGIGSEKQKQQAELEKYLLDFKAKLAAFEASKTEIEKQITQAQTLYEKYDAEARALHSKADTMEIVSAVVGGLGEIAGAVSTAVAGYYGSQTPKINIGSTSPATPEPKVTPDNPSQPSAPSSDKPLPTDEGKNDSPDVAARKTRLGSNKAELDLVSVRLEGYPDQIDALENEKKSVDKTRTDGDIDKEIKNLKDKQQTDSQRKKTLETEISEDEAYLKTRLASELGMSVAEASKSLEGRFDNIGNNARSAASAKDMLAKEILQLKFELESKNIENLSQIAELTQRVKNANIEVIDLSVVINSLQLAITCMSTVGSTLATVALFWKALENTCNNLADDDTIKALELTIKSNEDNPAKLVKHVTTSKTFGKNWFIMGCQWQALNLVSNAYYQACANAKDTLDISFTRAETDPKTHWKLAQSMAKDLEEKLNVTLRSEQSKDEAFKKRVEFAEKEKEKMLADFTK